MHVKLRHAYLQIGVSWRSVSYMDALQEEVADLDYAIGDRVNTLMHRHGYTRKAFGAKLGLGQSGMSLKISGQRTWTATEVCLAAGYLGVTVSVLYGDEPMPEPTRPATVTALDVSRNIEKELRFDNSHRAIVTQIFRPATSELTDAA